MHSRRLAPACLSLGSRHRRNIMRYSSLSSALAPLKWRIYDAAKDRFFSFSSTAVWTKFFCEQPLFTEMKYLASRQFWNLQTLKVPDPNSWVVPSTHFKFRNRDLCCTIHRNTSTPIHKQYLDAWEIERFIFKLKNCWKITLRKPFGFCTEKSTVVGTCIQANVRSFVEEFPLFGKLRTCNGVCFFA